MKKLSPNAPTWTAVTIAALGFVMIFMAWNGAAGIALAQAQIPYLISGGLGGVALVGAGMVLIRTYEGRRDIQQVVQRLDRLADAVERLAEQLPGDAAAVRDQGRPADRLQDSGPAQPVRSEATAEPTRPLAATVPPFESPQGR